MKDIQFELKRIEATFAVEKEASFKDVSIENVLGNINHLLKLSKAHNISQVENKISFRNSFIERGFRVTLMGILSCGNFEVLQNGSTIKVDFKCKYSLVYDLCFFLLGLLLSLFSLTFSIWCIGAVGGFWIRYYVVSTKSKELISRIFLRLEI